MRIDQGIGLRILIAASFVASAPSLAVAQTETLNYVGSPFTEQTIDGNITNGLANSLLENTGQVVLSAPLGDNLANVQVIPLSWSFDSGSRFAVYLNSDSPFIGEPGTVTSFSFSTDASGNLTGWNITLDEGILGGTNSPSFADVSITNQGDSYGSGFSTPSCGAAPPEAQEPCYFVSESNTAAGQWTASIAQSPELDVGSTASALTLLLGGLLVLRGRRAGTQTGT